jgi:FkbM family methyltransferase
MIRATPNWASILGMWEPEAARVYGAFVNDGDVVYDCGANVGIHTLLFSKLVGPRGKVLAFEPLPEAARDIVLNSALNDVKNVSVHEYALSDRPGTAQFQVAHLTTQGSLSGMNGAVEGQGMTVPLSTLDAVIAAGAPLPDFIKMDIEGAEGAALAGFEKVVTSYPVFAIDLHTPEQDLEVGSFFARHGYDVYRLGDFNSRRFGQKETLRKIARLDKKWPTPDGIWGTIVAIHPSRTPRLRPGILEQLTAP